MPWVNTEKHIRSGHRDAEEFQQDTLKTITLNEKEGIKAIVGKPKGKDTMEVVSYVFEKDKGWTLEKAKAWFAKHHNPAKEHVYVVLPFTITEKIMQNPLSYAACLFTLDAGKEADAEHYPVLNLWLSRESSFNGNVTLTLFDVADRTAGHQFTIGHEKWFQTQVGVGAADADVWQMESGFEWTQVKKVQVVCWFDGVSTGSFWVDGLFFGGRRYSTMQEDVGSQSSYGLRELVEVNEELWSDGECESRAKALLTSLKDPAEHLRLEALLLIMAIRPCWRATLCMLLCLMKGATGISVF
jgi:hypothetical protein